MKKQTQKLMKSVYELLSDIKDLAVENILDISIYLGLPLVALTYFDWRAALATLVIATIAVEVIEVWPRKAGK